MIGKISFSNWSPVSFGIAAGLFLTQAVLAGTSWDIPSISGNLLFLTSLIILVLGLLGFYQPLAARASWLARISTGVLTLAGGGLLIVTLWLVITALSGESKLLGSLFILSLFGIVLSFVLLTVASLRTGDPSPTVGRLMVGINIIWVGGLAVLWGGYGGNAPHWFPVATNGAIAVMLFAIAYELRDV